MKKLFVACAFLALSVTSANAQVEPDYNAAINMNNLFQKQCFGNFPDFEKVRADAAANNWVVGPLLNGKAVSWAANEGMNNFSLMIVDSPANSSKTCEVRGNVSEDTAVSVFNGIYADKIHAQRTGAPENSWNTPNGRVTIDTAPDGRTSIILAK
jgi:hypothetical protein